MPSTPTVTAPLNCEAPAISIELEMSNVAASSSPEIVKFLCPVVSILASVVTTLEAIAVPAVNPSNNSNSASVNSALDPRVKVPVTVKLSAIVTSEVECPIVIAIPDVSVATFKAPTAFVIYEFDPS